MVRLIDAYALKEDCKRYLGALNPDTDGKECARIHWLIDVLENAPTIEPERKTGKWIIRHPEEKNIFSGKTIECSECGTRLLTQYVEDEKYCRSCGAKMEEGDA